MLGMHTGTSVFTKWLGVICLASGALLCCQSAVQPVHASSASAYAASGLIRNLSIPVGGLTRTFDVFLPTQIPATPVPLVFLLHGHGGDADTLTGMSGKKAPFKIWQDIAQREKLILVFPNGTIGPDGKRGWNDGRADSSTNPTVDDIAFIEALVTEANTYFNIDADQIFAAGVSNGGGMALRIGSELAHHFDAICAVVMNMPAQPESGPPPVAVSTLFVNGTDDPLVPWNGGAVGKANSGRGTVLSAQDSVMYWVQHNQTKLTPTVVDLPNLDKWDKSTVRYHQYDGGLNNSRVGMYQVSGGGHATPSRAERYAFVWELIVGRQNHDIECADAIWNFFQGG